MHYMDFMDHYTVALIKYCSIYFAGRYFIPYQNNFTQKLKCDGTFNRAVLTNGIDLHGFV